MHKVTLHSKLVIGLLHDMTVKRNLLLLGVQATLLHLYLHILILQYL